VAQLTLAEAAKSAGRSKSALLRSIKAGRLSAERDALTAGWLIDVSELHRVYPAPTEARRDAAIDAPHTMRDAPEMTELRARLDDALDQIQDLRRQRDAEAQERRRLTALLEDRRAIPARTSWWRWW
jgi:hypothetical protein